MSGTVVISQKDLWSMPTITVNGALTMPTLPSIPALPGLPTPIYSSLHMPHVEFQTILTELYSYNTTAVMKKMTDILFGIIPTAWPTIPNLSFSFPDILAGSPAAMMTEINTAMSKGVTFPGVPTPLFSTTISPAMTATHTYMLIVRNYLQTIANLIMSVINKVIGKLSALGLPGLPAIPAIPSPDSVFAMLKSMVMQAVASAEASVNAQISAAEQAVSAAENEVATATSMLSSVLASTEHTITSTVSSSYKSAVASATTALSNAQANYSNAKNTLTSAYGAFTVPSVGTIAGSIPTKFGFPSIPFPSPLIPTMSHIDHDIVQCFDSIQTSYSVFVMKLVAGWNGWNLIGGLPLPSPISITIPF